MTPLFWAGWIKAKGGCISIWCLDLGVLQNAAHATPIPPPWIWKSICLLYLTVWQRVSPSSQYLRWLAYCMYLSCIWKIIWKCICLKFDKVFVSNSKKLFVSSIWQCGSGRVRPPSTSAGSSHRSHSHSTASQIECSKQANIKDWMFKTLRISDVKYSY